MTERAQPQKNIFSNPEQTASEIYEYVNIRFPGVVDPQEVRDTVVLVNSFGAIVPHCEQALIQSAYREEAKTRFNGLSSTDTPLHNDSAPIEITSPSTKPNLLSRMPVLGRFTR